MTERSEQNAVADVGSEPLLSVEIDHTAKGLDAIREAMKSIPVDSRIPFFEEHEGPFQARNGSVFDQRTGQYIAYCCGNHNGCKLSPHRNAKAIADALNKAIVGQED